MSAKPWYKSATIYALMVSITAQLLHALGIGDDAAHDASIKFTEGFLPFVGILSDAIAAWGRSRAQGPVTMTQGAAVTKSSQGGFASVWMLVGIAASMIAVVSIGGCALKPVQPEARLVLETSVRIAVRHAVADSPRAAQKAQNIRRIVAMLQSSAPKNSTIASLKSAVDADLNKLNLTPLDRSDADDLLALLAVALESQMEARGVNPAALVSIEDFLKLVLNSIPPPAAT